MNKELIEEILNYVERTVEKIDGEWGSNRSFEKVLENDEDDDDVLIPDFYFKLKAML